MPIQHLVLPAIALGLAVVRLPRAAAARKPPRDLAREPFIVVARSKGLRRWTAFRRHALPNAFLPTLTAGGLLFAQLIAGSRPDREGVQLARGRLASSPTRSSRQDYAVVQTFILLSAILYVIINLVIDILYGVIDPRVRRACPGMTECSETETSSSRYGTSVTIFHTTVEGCRCAPFATSRFDVERGRPARGRRRVRLGQVGARRCRSSA